MTQAILPILIRHNLCSRTLTIQPPEDTPGTVLREVVLTAMKERTKVFQDGRRKRWMERKTPSLLKKSR